jgi:ribosome-associated heat shock protein Hsp15
MINHTESQEVRLDKWLWAARFFKTRRLAKDAIEGGKVHYAGQRAKVSKKVEIGATLKIRQGLFEKIITVKALSNQRRGAPEAALLYEETVESTEKRERELTLRKMDKANTAPDRRPNKKERRTIINFKNKNFEGDSEE